MKLPSEVKQSDAIIDESVLSRVKRVDLTLAAFSFFSPRRGHTVMHLWGDAAVEMVDIQGIQALLQPVALIPKAVDYLQPFLALIKIGLFESALDEPKNFVIDSQPAELL